MRTVDERANAGGRAAGERYGRLEAAAGSEIVVN